MNVELASCPRPAAVRRPLRWGRLLLGVNVLAILAVAVALRGWRLGNIPGLNGDEAWSGVQAMRLVSGQSISWRTPTGNPVNPFYLGPLAALHLWLAPSAAVLRLPALFSGLAALVANYLLCKRVFGPTVAWVSTLLLAVLPLNIAYSRFAWDASQTLLATTLLMYFALQAVETADRPRRSLLAPMLAYAAAIWIHPTNLFAGWLLLVPAVHGYRAELQEAWARLRRGRLAGSAGLGAGGLLVVALLFLGLGLLALRLAGVGFSAAATPLRPLALAVLARIADPAEWGLFARLLVRLLSGSTIFQFIPGPQADTTALDGLDLMFCCVIVAAGFGLLRILKDPAAARERCLALGSLGMAASFFLIAGPAAIAPHAERYGVCLIAPGVALIAVGLSHWLAPRRRVARPALAALCLLAWLVLGAFGWRYHASILRSGGDSHLAFRTAAVEPKQEAWEYIARHSDARPIVVVADSWWIYWPLAYLSAGHPEARVVRGDELTPEEFGRKSATALWLVEFCQSPAGESVDERLAPWRQGAAKSS